jgi:guanosine-3',5'-bis(diphosphate) 3'-pyrophosphohydrolase
MVVTGKARAAIRRATRAAVRRQYAGLGRRILDRAFERARSRSTTSCCRRRCRGSPRATSRTCWPRSAAARSPGLKFSVPGIARKTKPGSKRRKGRRSIPIRGVTGDMPVRFAEGGALPGERIVGIAVPGEGVTIYPIGAQALKAFDDQPERWLDVRWDLEAVRNERFPARIEVTAMNEPGTLAQIAQVIADSGANISNLRITKAASDFSVMVIDVEVFDVKHLTRLVTQLRAKPVVSSVIRING